MEPTNEPSPADGDRKIEENVKNDFDKAYDEMIKKEQDALEARFKGEATAQFDTIRKLGFATKKDIEEQVKGIFGKFVEQQQKNEEQIKKLTDWVMRAKMHGLSSGATDDQPHVEDPLKKWRPQW